MTRSTSISCLLAIAILPAMAIACGESGSSGPTPVSPRPAPAPTAPPPESSSPAPPATEPSPSTQECTGDIDCATTTLPAAPIESESDCCFPSCQKRVASRARIEELQAAFGATCKAVLCAPQSCQNAVEPVPVCREGACVARP